MSHIIASAGINYANPVKIGGTGTGVKIFPSVLSSAAPAILQVLEQQNGQVVTLTASGTLFVHGASPTIIPTLQSGTSLTSGSNTTVSVLTAAQSLTTNAQYPFALVLGLQGDSVSGIVQVVSAQFVCNGVVSLMAAFTNTSLTGVTFGNVVSTDGFYKPENPLNLVFGINFTVSDALNAASLYEYQLEA
jgi:hypothetical protein